MSSFGAPVVSDEPTSDGETDLGSGAIYQYIIRPGRRSVNHWRRSRAGYDAIQVPPAQRSKRTWADPEPRGYQPIDHLDFTSVFGTETEYRAMIEEAHEQGLDVIADAVLNHMAEGVNFDAFPHFDWYDFHHGGRIRDDRDEWELENRDLEGLPDLRQGSQRVRDHLESYVQKYADCNVDGLRWDAVKHMPAWFFRDYANPWDEARGLYTIGEVLHGSVSYCESYLETGMSVMDYPLYFTMREKAFHSDGDLSALADAGVAARHPHRTVTFVSNHDSPPPEHEMLAYAFILTHERYPRVYSGRIDIDDEAIATLLSIRRTYAAGPARTRHAGRDVYVFERQGNLLVGLNRTQDWQSVQVQTSWETQSLTDHSGSAQTVTTEPDGQVELSLPPTGWVCYAP